MNFRILGRFLGALLLLESIAMAACGLFAWIDSLSHDDDPYPLFLAAMITAAGGAMLMLGGIVKIDRIPRREGIVVVGLGWVLCGVFGSLPYMLGDPSLPPADALFESVSGFTTTGSTVMTDIASWPRGILMWRSVTQWMGGMGILVLFVAILSYLGMGSKSLFRNESSFQTGEATTARIRDTAMTLWYIYVCITAVCAVGLKLMGLTTYNAISHAFTVVSTGGFSPHNASIAHYSHWTNGWLIELWLSLFMVICSISFLFWVVLLRKRWKRLKDDEEGLFFIVLCFASAVVIGSGVAASQGMHPLTALRHSWFTVTSIASTTGYGTVDYASWPGFALILLAGLMLLGGCSGSTAGGLKVSRLIVFLKTARFEIVKAFRPNRIFRMHVNGNALGANDRAQTMVFVSLYAFIILISCFLVALVEASNEMDMITAFGAVVATLANIGPGFGEVGPAENFGHLLPVTKVFLSLLMILGRLELYAMLVLFMPSVWKRY
ncbi:TrkH family potassium uptake protein [Verrucomicrobiaceae bacterium N1E253]|uniref:TrkH family potassium uptake protein n=1 Tax=Oceaniferula marina TaxID=2748318 RepID=A0A851GF19_9BACT|nr:TrkH family potassium uptake protein [Oceaniferula marina]NWK56016.1 TrkH family potassium uptake protein [Oceaniferula marina]